MKIRREGGGRAVNGRRKNKKKVKFWINFSNELVFFVVFISWFGKIVWNVFAERMLKLTFRKKNSFYFNYTFKLFFLLFCLFPSVGKKFLNFLQKIYYETTQLRTLLKTFFLHFFSFSFFFLNFILAAKQVNWLFGASKSLLPRLQVFSQQKRKKF